MTDNGPSLCSDVMEEFSRVNYVFHINISSYTSCYGAAENIIRTVKYFLEKYPKNSDVNMNICKFHIIIKYD